MHNGGREQHNHHRSRAELSSYCDPSIPLDTPTRHDFCPFCHHRVSANGFIVWRTNYGWRLYCHRCGTSRHVNNDRVSSPSALISRVNGLLSAVKPKSRVIYLPEDFTLEIPFSGRAWLRKYGVTDDEIKRYRFGYSERMNRLIMPVFNDGELVFWQARRLSGNKEEPKYISMKSTVGGAFFNLSSPGAKEVVLVEDVVSAIVLRRAGYNSTALLGSYIGDRVAAYLANSGVKQVCVWLDPDKRRDSVRFSRALSWLGFSATCLVTPTKDPKDYSITQIRAHLAKGGFRHEQSVPSS